ncbi:aminoglycoside phosphotransferase (APT) family kinase protein [Caulobacter ginsengisoli]|uniref:Aminoglycoside phosphotransferase (APT) family kinase protein n=1 Tax=Caulobacter ginsengisoli TaxID=400775 RepID=A0ABU0ISB5_9CAUL|nr:phosphotransferase family protein [Caulobacter ginsengisoli]MDQ0464310.1 aminoglycoside phosphotransferase (APT) family kinase protein [Caulobacter ginsengisoli]
MSIEGVDLAVLTGWMDGRGLGEGPIENPVRLAGGTQNILLKFTRAGRSYVLRRPPPHLRDNSNETMRREARVLGAIRDTTVPHPRLIAAEPDETVLGAAFYLMEPIDGFNPTTGLEPLHAGSPDIRHRMGLALVEGIAGLGALDYRALGLEGLGKPDNYLERQVARWKAQLASYGEFPDWTGPGEIPGVERVAAWLEAHRPASFEAGIIHGDYHLANVMYRHDSGELAAIVDWELTTIGDPLLDLGWLLATWPLGDDPDAGTVSVRPWRGFPTATELVGHYRPRTHRDLSAIAWYGVLACYKLGIILEGSHARASAGKAPKEIGDRLHAQTVSLFERALGWIR